MRSSFILPVTILIHYLSLISVGSPVWDLRITIQARHPVSESHSECFHFSQVHWSLTARHCRSGGKCPIRDLLFPLSYALVDLNFQGGEKGGKYVVKKLLLPGLHNPKTDVHKGPGNILGSSWRWRTHRVTSHTPSKYSIIVSERWAPVTDEMAPPKLLSWPPEEVFYDQQHLACASTLRILAPYHHFSVEEWCVAYLRSDKC